MQDTDVIDSFLYVMLGIPASGIKLIDSKTGYLFKVDEKMMSSSQNELITRILPIAEAYGVINDFVNSSLGIVTYDTLPSEQGLLPKKNPGVYDVVKLIKKEQAFGAQILDILIRQTKMNGTANQKLYQTLIQLTSKAFNPYFSMLSDWIYGGLINDPFKEFMVEELSSRDRERERDSIMSEEADTTNKQWTRQCKLQERRIGKMLSDDRREKFEYKKPDDSFQQIITNAYTFASQELLRIVLLEENLIDRLRSIKSTFLFAGGDFFVHFMDLAEKELQQKVPLVCMPRIGTFLDLALRSSSFSTQYSSQSSPSSQSSQSSPSSSSSIVLASEIENNIIEDPYRECYSCYLSKMPLVKHLQEIQNIPSQQSQGSQQVSKLKAEQNDFSSQDGSGGSIVVEQRFEPSGIAALVLSHQVPFSISLVLNKIALFKYQLLFRHLFLLKSVERRLVKVATNLMMSRRLHANEVPVSILHHAEVVRRRMQHIVQTILYFTFQEVIEPAWNEFLKSIDNCRNIDGLIERHMSFLDICLKDSLMTNQNIITILTVIEAQSLAFCKLIEETIPLLVHPGEVQEHKEIDKATRTIIKQLLGSLLINETNQGPDEQQIGKGRAQSSGRGIKREEEGFEKIIHKNEVELETKTDWLMQELEKMKQVDQKINVLSMRLDYNERYLAKKNAKQLRL
ncbi:MAG: putative Gamma-tubulin complex component 2 [Streblomastix strix]|uniref:Putative Gamma-tubulin complex component 2 n=1 Tax=Streblomastix strix TaxID=222440 RepID=A0A5J4X2E3_9EUKA|nr:MAG: putative Gamma-tubulin complex component 2 [Streblomastix strix]